MGHKSQHLAGAPDLFITVLVQDLIVLYLHDDKDDQKPTANTKKDIPTDDEDSQDDDEQDNQDNNEQEMIKKGCIKEMFAKHFKSTLGPQDNDNGHHPATAHMYAVHITETMNVLQAMVHNQWQLLDLYHAMTCQDSFYIQEYHFQNDNGVNE